METLLNADKTRAVKLWFAVSLVFAMALPMLILYSVGTLGPLIVNEFNISASTLGFFITGCFGTAALFSVFSGNWVNQLGSRRGLGLLFAAVTVAFVLLAFIPNLFSVTCAMVLCGFSQSLANPVTNLLIAEQVTNANKAAVVGIKQAGVQLSALLAGLILPGIAVAIGWRGAVGAIIPIALLFLLTTPLVTKEQHRPKHIPHHLPNSLLRRLMGIQLCAGICLSAFVSYLPSFAVQQGMSITTAGSLIALFGAAGMASRISLTPIAATMNNPPMLLLVLLLITVCTINTLPFCGAGQSWPLWLSALGVGLSAVATNAIAMSMLVKDDRFGAVASSSSWVSVAFFSGFAIGPALFGQLYNVSAMYSWCALSLILLPGTFLSIALYRSDKAVLR